LVGKNRYKPEYRWLGVLLGGLSYSVVINVNNVFGKRVMYISE